MTQNYSASVVAICIVISAAVCAAEDVSSDATAPSLDVETAVFARAPVTEVRVDDCCMELISDMGLGRLIRRYTLFEDLRGTNMGPDVLYEEDRQLHVGSEDIRCTIRMGITDEELKAFLLSTKPRRASKAYMDLQHRLESRLGETQRRFMPEPKPCLMRTNSTPHLVVEERVRVKGVEILVRTNIIQGVETNGCAP